MICKSILIIDLIIDDDEGVREMLRNVLEMYGYLVFTASHGKDGFEKLKTVPFPCLVLLDLMMPVMNGWEFLEELEKSHLSGKTAVIVLTAFMDQTKVKPVNAQALLQKPIDLTTLLSFVEQYTSTERDRGRSLA